MQDQAGAPIAIGGVAVIYGVFDQLLSVQLWNGFLPTWAMDANWGE